MKKFLVFTLMAVMLITLLSGCGGGDQTVDPPKRDTINVSIVQQIPTADPQENFLIQGDQVLFQTYEPLIYIAENAVVQPKLVENYKISNDGLTYTFNLRKDVLFHNGEKMTADDVVFSFNRALEFAHIINQLPNYKEIKKIDEHTVTIHATSVSSTFINGISRVHILSEKAVTEAGEDFGIKAVDSGTGPYRQTYFKGDDRIDLEAFDDYYLGAPAIKKATFHLITDASTLATAFQAGELQLSTIPEAYWEEVHGSGKYNTFLAPTTHTTYLLLNNNRAPFNDVRVRQAINYAINREEMVLLAYENLADIAYFMANPEKVFGATLDGVNKYPYNPEKAKELLADAGYADGLKITITSASIYFFEKIATIMQGYLADIGVTADIEILEANAARAKYPIGDYDIGVMGLNVKDTVDFLSAYYDTTGGNRFGQIVDPKPFEMLQKANAELDRNKREAMYKEFCQYTNDNAFFAPLFHRYLPYAWDKDLNAKIGLDYYFIYDFSWKD